MNVNLYRGAEYVLAREGEVEARCEGKLRKVASLFTNGKMLIDKRMIFDVIL